MKAEDRKSNYIIAFLVILVVGLIAISVVNKKEVEITGEAEESIGSGLLEVETFPGNADIFVDDEYKGISPATLYNIPAGRHAVAIKKAGYEDYMINVEIEAGKKAFVEANLDLIPIVEEKPEADKIAEEKVEEKPKEESPDQESIINVGSRVLLYYDFSEKRFTENKQLESDVFSKRFDTYFVFTRYSPVNIKTIDKNIDAVEKEDCIGVKGSFEYLHSGKSLCLITKEGQIVVLGGYWENTRNVELRWKVFD